MIVYLALFLTFRQGLTFLDFDGSRVNQPNGQLFIHIFSQAIQLFIMTVILSNTIKSKWTRNLVNVLTMVGMCVGSTIAFEKVPVELASIKSALAKNVANMVSLFVSLFINQWIF